MWAEMPTLEKENEDCRNETEKEYQPKERLSDKYQKKLKKKY